jgi:hypothetical protein
LRAQAAGACGTIDLPTKAGQHQGRNRANGRAPAGRVGACYEDGPPARTWRPGGGGVHSSCRARRPYVRTIHRAGRPASARPVPPTYPGAARRPAAGHLPRQRAGRARCPARTAPEGAAVSAHALPLGADRPPGVFAGFRRGRALDGSVPASGERSVFGPSQRHLLRPLRVGRRGANRRRRGGRARLTSSQSRRALLAGVGFGGLALLFLALTEGGPPAYARAPVGGFGALVAILALAKGGVPLNARVPTGGAGEGRGRRPRTPWPGLAGARAAQGPGEGRK